MKSSRFFFAGLVVAAWSVGVVGFLDDAHAQSACGCPAGYVNLGNQCFSAPRNFAPLICQNQVPVGQVPASQQQLSFSTVSGMLSGVRDRLQGNPNPSSAAPLGYSRADFDESFNALGYASNGPAGNPLTALKAPPKVAISSGPTWAAWTEGMGDWERRGPLNASDIGRTQTSYGVHAGFDGTWQNTLTAGDYLVAGVVTDWMTTRVNFAGGVGGFRLEGPGVGLYSLYIRGGFSADLTGKVDFLKLAEDFAGAAPNAFTDVTNAGLSGNIQYKSSIGSAFIEPTTGFSLTRTMFGDNAAALSLTDATTLRVQAGARFSQPYQIHGIIFEPTLGLFVYENVIAEGTTLVTTPFAIPISPTDQGLVRGEVDPELNMDFSNGYTAYVRGSVRFGTEMAGGFAKLGVRKQF
jgi:hypothetical protein